MQTNSFSRLIALIIVLALPVTAAQGETESGKVLVFGGTGMIGYEIVKALKKQDRDVTVFVRASSNIEDLRKIDVPYVIGDVLEPETLRQALEQGAYGTVIREGLINRC